MALPAQASRLVGSGEDGDAGEQDDDDGNETAAAAASETHFVAFKAFRKDAVKVTSLDGSAAIKVEGTRPGASGETAQEVIQGIAARIEEECAKVGGAGPAFISEKDIVSVAESKAATSIVDRLSHRWVLSF